MQYLIESNTIDVSRKIKEQLIEYEYPKSTTCVLNPGCDLEKYNRMSELNKMKRKDLKKLVKEAK